MEQLVQDWERIYLTLVGSQERILNLTDKELHTLLDPLQTQIANLQILAAAALIIALALGFYGIYIGSRRR